MRRIDHRKWLLGSLGVILLVAVGSFALAFQLLWGTYLDEQRDRLIGLVHSQARLIDAVASFDLSHSQTDHPQGAVGATLSQIAEAYRDYKGFGDTGEFVFGRRDGDHIIYLLSQRNFDLRRPEPIAMDSGLGIPMRLALEKKEGVVLALDYRGVKVLAAYSFIPALNAGFVAKIDYSEVRAPFVRIGLLASGGLLFIVVLAGGVFRRISAPLLRNHELSLSLRKLSHALEQSPLIVFITDLAGRIEYVNPKFTEVTGYSSKEAVGQTPALIKSDLTPQDIHKSLWETILRGETWRSELADKRKDGTLFWASVLIAPVRDENGVVSHFVAIHEDISARKQVEAQMVEALRQTELANRAKSELIANMSHELRTPLNAIIGFSSMMENETWGPLGHDKYREYVKDISWSGEHLLSLINDILDVSAIEAGKSELHEEEVSFGEVASACLRLIGPRAKKGAVRVVYEPGEDVNLFVDARRMKQVLLNLLSNAVKFTPEGGDVILNAAIPQDGGFVFRVVDTGIGMDEAGIEKALTPFGQVDSDLNRKHEGTGLGLPLTIKLVEMHSGRLGIASALGQGTTVEVILPKERVVRG